MSSMNEKTTYFFVDESGDPFFYNRRGELIVGKEGCSKILMLGLIKTANPTLLRKELEKLRGEILNDAYLKDIPSVINKTSKIFHATNDCPEVREETMRILDKVKPLTLKQVHKNLSEGGFENELFKGLSIESIEGDIKQLPKNMKEALEKAIGSLGEIALEPVKELLAALNKEGERANVLRMSIAKILGEMAKDKRIKFKTKVEIVHMVLDVFENVSSHNVIDGSIVAGLIKSKENIFKPGEVAKALGVNVKLARYIQKSHHDFKDILHSENKASVNTIAYDLNREKTTHPSERRVGEDEKDSLFDYLFGEENDIEQMRVKLKIFKKFFENNPDDYHIPLASENDEAPSLVKLLKYVNLKQVEKMIRGIIEDPKESLDEIRSSLKKAIKDPKHPFFIGEQDDPDKLIEEMDWILSNMFVLKDKVAKLKNLSRNVKDMETLRSLLSEIHLARSVAQLEKIAKNYDLDWVKVFEFKLESTTSKEREDLFINTFMMMDKKIFGMRKANKEIDPTWLDFLQEAKRLFKHLNYKSKKRVLANFIIQKTKSEDLINRFRSLYADEWTIMELDTVEQMAGLIGLETASPVAEILFENKETFKEFIVSDGKIVQFLDSVEDLESKGKQRAAMQLFAELYSKRSFTRQEWDRASSEIKQGLKSLEQEIVTPVQTKIPHVFLESLLKLEAEDDTLEILRKMFEAIDHNPELRNQTATMKNRFYEKINLHASRMDEINNDIIFANILKVLVERRGIPNVNNVEDFHNEFLIYLDNYYEVIDAWKKSLFLV